MRVGVLLADVPGKVSWRAVLAMVRHSLPGSAYHQVKQTDESPWPREQQLMGFFIDAVNDFMWLYQCAHTGKGQPKPKRPQPFPQPGAKAREDSGVQHIGSDPIPAGDFAAWWANPVSMN